MLATVEFPVSVFGLLGVEGIDYFGVGAPLCVVVFGEWVIVKFSAIAIVLQDEVILAKICLSIKLGVLSVELSQAVSGLNRDAWVKSVGTAVLCTRNGTQFKSLVQKLNRVRVCCSLLLHSWRLQGACCLPQFPVSLARENEVLLLLEALTLLLLQPSELQHELLPCPRMLSLLTRSQKPRPSMARFALSLTWLQSH